MSERINKILSQPCKNILSVSSYQPEAILTSETFACWPALTKIILLIAAVKFWKNFSKIGFLGLKHSVSQRLKLNRGGSVILDIDGPGLGIGFCTFEDVLIARVSSDYKSMNTLARLGMTFEA